MPATQPVSGGSGVRSNFIALKDPSPWDVLCSLYRGTCESHWHNVVDSGECLGVNGAAAAKEGSNIVTGCPWCVWWVNCAVFQPAAVVRKYLRGPAAGGRRIDRAGKNVADGFSQGYTQAPVSNSCSATTFI
jgi:hypothetical protein